MQTPRKILRRLTRRSPLALSIASTVRTHLAIYANTRDEAKQSELAHARFSSLFPDLIVRNGPFRGMIYPSREAAGSEFYPKILGSYEQELHETLAYITRQPYSAVVDVGCAEGYYAVGLGLILKNARIYAFDTNSDARSMCAKMAEINGVEVTTGGHCDKEILLDLNLGSKALIFSDCEGYENRLFDRDIAQKHSNHDFLIETHDFLEIATTRDILSAFQDTHECSVIESVDDIMKAYTYEFDELKDFDLGERLRILSERRPTIMRWIFAKSKASPGKIEPSN